MKYSLWIPLDTETTDFKAPIYVVELTAQLMRSWMTEGSPFQCLLNHNAGIPRQRLHSRDSGEAQLAAAFSLRQRLVMQ